MARNPAAKPNPAKIAQQQHDCLQLRLRGLTVREIAEELGVPRSTVQDRLQAGIDELVLPVADEVRQLELARLDDYTRRLVQRMDDGEAAERIVPIALKVQERRSRYLGLDAPERAEVTTTVLPTADSAVEALLAQGRAELT